MASKGVASMVLTIGSKTLPTAFFVTEAQGNFSLILGHDWIHANHCVPSTLHQMLIQWIGDEVEIVYGDSSACVATVDSSSISAYDNIRCLTGVGLSDFEYISCTQDDFVTATLKPVWKSAMSQNDN